MSIETLDQFLAGILVFIVALILFVFFLKRLLAWMDDEAGPDDPTRGLR